MKYRSLKFESNLVSGRVRACLSTHGLSFCLPCSRQWIFLLPEVSNGYSQSVFCWPRVADVAMGDKCAPGFGEFQMTLPDRGTLVPCCQTPLPSPLEQLWTSLGSSVYKSLAAVSKCRAGGIPAGQELPSSSRFKGVVWKEAPTQELKIQLTPGFRQLSVMLMNFK